MVKPTVINQVDSIPQTIQITTKEIRLEEEVEEAENVPTTTEEGDVAVIMEDEGIMKDTIEEEDMLKEMHQR